MAYAGSRPPPRAQTRALPTTVRRVLLFAPPFAAVLELAFASLFVAALVHERRRVNAPSTSAQG